MIENNLNVMIETDVVNEEILFLLSKETMKKFIQKLVLRMITLKCQGKNRILLPQRQDNML